MARATATVLLGFGLCLIGAAFDSASLYLPGVAIAVLAGVAATWVALAARGARVTRAPGPASVVEGEPFRVRLDARLGLLPAPGGELSDPLLAGATVGELGGAPLAGEARRARPGEVPSSQRHYGARSVSGRRRARLDGLATLDRRGRLRPPPSVLTIRDPLGLAVRRVLAPEAPELLVLPRVEPVTVAASGGDASAGALAGLGAAGRSAAGRRDESSDGLDLDGLRPYREGTPATRIHWATLARRGEMMERRFVAASASAPLVVLDAGEPADADALDAAVRATASLCVALARVEGVALLLPGDRRPIEIDHGLGAWPALHRRLALVEAGVGPSLGGLGARSGALLWVTGAATESVPPQLARLQLRPRYVVAPTLPAGTVPELEVAGCGVAPIDRVRRSAVA